MHFESEPTTILRITIHDFSKSLSLRNRALNTLHVFAILQIVIHEKDASSFLKLILYLGSYHKIIIKRSER
jgi:hypothetical protein